MRVIKEQVITLFTLRVYTIPEHLRETRLLIALEQYYILSLVPEYNTLMVASGSPGGKAVAEQTARLQSIPLYLYVGSTVVYVFNSMNGKFLGNNAIDGLGTSTNKLAPLLNDGILFKDALGLSRNPPLGMTLQDVLESGALLSFEQMKALVASAKADYKAAFVRVNHPDRPTGPKPTTPPLTITRVFDGAVFSFRGTNAARM